MNKLPDFALNLLASLPRRGGGLNIALFRAARVLHAFCTEVEIIELLRAATYGEPIKPGEIERAVERSKSCAYVPGQPSQNVAPAWPELNVQKREAVISKGGGLVDLWEISPVRIEDNQAHTEHIIDTLFPGDPLLCAGHSNSDFETRSRNEWRGKLAELAVIVPSPMTARQGKTQEGKISAHALETTGPRRFLVIEQDTGTIDDQAAILLHLAQIGPLALAVHSGGKSIHGWFACQDRTEDQLRRFMRYAVSLGADHATWTRSQFVRMPDGRREGGKQQTVSFFNPKAISATKRQSPDGSLRGTTDRGSVSHRLRICIGW